MQYLRTIPATALALAIAGASVVCNYRFGQTLAPGFDGQLYAVLGAVGDALKALLPILILAAWRAHEPLRVVVGTLLFAALATYSLTSALGLYATSRNATVGNIEIVQVEAERLSGEIQHLQASLSALGMVEPPAAVAARITALKHDRLFDRSKRCTDATALDSRALCAEIANTMAKLLSSQKGTKLSERLAQLKSDRRALDLRKVVTVADPQAAALANLTGWKQESIRGALAVLIAVLIELGSSFGLLLATAGTNRTVTKISTVKTSDRMPLAVTCTAVKTEPEAPQVEGNEVIDWANARLRRKIGNRVQAADLYSDYQAWMADREAECLALPQFARTLTAAGLPRERIGGKGWLVDYEISDHRSLLRLVS